MIQIENLNKSFGTRQVLFDISTTFERGLCNLIIGASGCGKSVMLKCILGLEEPDSGNIFYDNRNFTQSNLPFRKNIRKEVGVVFQGNALFDSLTVEQNVRFPLEMNGMTNKGEIDDRVNFCLQRVNLTNTNHLYPSEISGGMKKRVAIARAISLNPKYLLLDEPNSGLDPQTSIVIDQLINEITQEFDITTIVVTHDMNSVMEIGDTIAFFYKGKLWWKGNKDKIVHDNNKELDEFVYASTFMRRYKETYNQ